MLNITMFRVEQPDGSGPYFADIDEDLPLAESLYHMRYNHTDADHLSPSRDPMLKYIADDEVCGFTTLGGLDNWFAGYEDALAEAGFSIVAYIVPYTSCRFGKDQGVFIRKHAEWSRTIPILDNEFLIP